MKIDWNTFLTVITKASLVKVKNRSFHRFYEHYDNRLDKLYFLNGPIREYAILKEDNEQVEYTETHYTVYIRIYDQVKVGEDCEGYDVFEPLETYESRPIQLEVWERQYINYSI